MRAFRKTQLCIFADKIPKAIPGNAAQLKNIIMLIISASGR